MKMKMVTIFTVTVTLFYLCKLYVDAASPIKVIVTGAAGRTGSLVLEKLIQSSLYEPVAVVRTDKSAEQLRKKIGNKCSVIVADVTDVSCLTSAFTGCEKLVMCTSAVPKIKILSIVKVFFLKLLQQSARPEFYFLPNGEPYSVDWLGAKNQIDAAKAAGIDQFVFVSSMGGTQPENFLNTIGRVEGDELSGNILLWKRKAEQYLIESGVPYTIIHPGGLIDKPGGEREVLLGVDDKFLTFKTRNIPRSDVAEASVQALGVPAALRRSIDIIAKEPSEGKPTTDWTAFFKQPGSCKY